MDISNESDDSSSNGKSYIVSAIAPTILNASPETNDIQNSIAYQALDEAFYEGKITGEKMARLKANYSQTYQALQDCRNKEVKLLQDAKQLDTTVHKQKESLRKAEEFPENDSLTEVSQLRQELLQHHNEVIQSENRCDKLNFEIESLQEEVRLIQREYERIPKLSEIEKKLKDLSKDSKEYKASVDQRTLEIKNLSEELEAKRHDHEILLKHIDKYMKEESILKDDLVRIHGEPANIHEQYELLARNKSDITNRKDELDRVAEDYNSELKQLDERRRRLEENKVYVTEELDNSFALLEAREREYDTLLKQFELSKEQETELLEQRASLEVKLRHANLERKNQHDINARKLREKERFLKNVKKIELQLKGSEDAYNLMKTIHTKAKLQLESHPKDDTALQQKRKELLKEVEAARRLLLQQSNIILLTVKNTLTSTERNRVEVCMAEEELLISQQCELRDDVMDLGRMVAIKTDEREQKSRDFMRAELRYHRALEDLKIKDLAIQDAAKKNMEMQQRLKDFAKLYDVIKNDRNKCVNLIQTSTQRAAEMREKIKILQNEIEILRTSVNAKERQYQKSKLKHSNSIIIKDSLRSELSKQFKFQQDNREKVEQQRLNITKLNSIINSAELDMLRLRERYESAVKDRNERGIQLIERNEEVCVFYEKVNIQDTVIRNGNLEINAKDEMIRFMNMEITELKRSIEVTRKEISQRKDLDDELVKLQIELSSVQDKAKELEKLVESPDNFKRIRFLDGKDMSLEEVHKRIEGLEIRLSEKEEFLLEKDLILEEISRLVERAEEKMNSRKDDTLNLARMVNDLKNRIKEMTRKTMSKISELSMNQAQTMKFQEIVKERERVLEQCYVRIEMGEAPSMEIEQEWQKQQRNESQRVRDKQALLQISEEEQKCMLPGGISTTAEPRPNAYIPDDDTELPIPRPYGVNAPFKPTQNGSNMRHIRKPNQKSIEI
ncbi:Coiled-coil domain-containing protein 146 [Trichoplax sp. H2]|nr:Coiled-coil domain-containing protein 146 [Trichoplax sp. H2]|eukprot:RDD46769.1 Coiled-coil domain-containing protein 146 [Trichoplax sp. H2]